MKNGLEFVQHPDTIKVESLMNGVFCMAHFFISRQIIFNFGADEAHTVQQKHMKPYRSSKQR